MGATRGGGAGKATLGKPKGGQPTLGKPAGGNFTFGASTANIGAPAGSASKGRKTGVKGGSMGVAFGRNSSRKPLPKATKRTKVTGVK